MRSARVAADFERRAELASRRRAAEPRRVGHWFGDTRAPYVRAQVLARGVIARDNAINLARRLGGDGVCRHVILNRPQKRPLTGVPVRRIDHVNLLARDVTANKEFMLEQLGFRLREHIVMNDGSEAGAWLSVSALVHEIAILRDATGSRGRLHHLCYWYGAPQHLADVVEVFRENGLQIEAGPGKHGITQALFLYVLEPGGNRIELFGDAGYLIFDPAWRPVTWHEENLEIGIVFYGGSLPAEFFTYGTPHVEVTEPAEVS